MIKIDISTAITFYLSASLLLTFMLWIFFDRRSRLNIDRDGTKKNVCQCPICLHTYLDSSVQDYSVCPQCGSYNEWAKVCKDKSKGGENNHSIKQKT